jgi:hypothetical protein
VNASAEYAIVPNVTAAGMASWAASRPLSILVNNDVASAVRDNRSGETGIVFWKPATVDGIQASAPAVVLVSTQRTSMRISAADPNGGTSGTFTLTVPGLWQVSGAAFTRTSRSTTLVIPRNGGQTTQVTLSRSVKRRAS